MHISIIIPAFNEAASLVELIGKIRLLPLDMEVIVVDDGSTDGTAEIIKELADDKVTLLINPENRGKGFAIRRALEIASGDIIVIQDADLEYNPSDILKLLSPFQQGAEVVYGSRILNKANKMSYLRYYYGGRLLTFVTNILFRSSLTDEPTGYKLFRKKLLQDLDLKCNGFEFCPEVTAKLLRRKVPIVEVPISYAPRSFHEGKKIHWSDGIYAIIILFKYRFLYKPRTKDPQRGSP